jgi:two-component system sensor histidine kinase DesK
MTSASPLDEAFPGPLGAETSDALSRSRGTRSWRVGWAFAALVFLLYPAFNIASEPTDPAEAALAVAAMVLFGAYLVPALARDDGRIGVEGWLPFAEVVALLAIAATLTIGWPEAGWSSIGFFASVSAGNILPERRALRLLLACGIVMGGALVASGSGAPEAFLTAIGITVIGFTVFAVASLRRTNRTLVAARSELARLAVLDERQRIARDLHDTLGHSLSLITLKSELAGRLLPDDPEGARREISDIETTARDALAAVRETVSGVRRPTLDAELAGVVGALRAAGIEPVVERSATSLPETTDALLAWAVREGVTNVMRHSRATRCTIRVGAELGDAYAEVVDDGPGPETAAPGPEEDPTAGTGLRGLAERVAAAGGAVVAGALPGRGYRLRVTLPLAPEPG